MQVPCNTAREFVAFADHLVKRSVFVGVYAADNAGEGLRGIAQHVNIRVDNGFGKSGRTAVHHNVAVCFFSTEGFHNGCPNLAQCTQFGNFHKEVSTLVKAEIQRRRYVFQAYAAFKHLADVFNGF